MSHSEKAVEPNLISCEVCRKEVPESEATVPEAVDYFVYFCGTDCYIHWANHPRPSQNHQEKSGS